MANYYHTQALTIGAQLDRDNYAKGLGTGQYPMSGVDLRHIGASDHSALEDVPLNRKVQPLLFGKDERHRALLEWMHERGENVTAQRAADALKVGRTTIIEWFSELRAERRVTTFTHNRRRYYTLTQSEIKRRKQWTR